MAVNYVYANPIGYYTETQERDYGTYRYKISMLRANCLWAELYFFKDKDDREMQQFVNFYSDLDHLKRSIKGGYLNTCNDYHFYSGAMTANTWKAVAELVKAGKLVTIENYGNGLYELPKTEFSRKEITADSWKKFKSVLADGFNVVIR